MLGFTAAAARCLRLQVFPGQGPPDATLNFTGGLSNVTAQLGQYLDNFLGAGGSGPTVVRSGWQGAGWLVSAAGQAPFPHVADVAAAALL